MATTVIEDELAAYLAALPAVQSQAGGRVYPFGAVAQNTAWPFVTYFRVSGRRIRSLRGPSGLSAPVVQIGCHGRTYGSAKQLADAIRVAIETFAPAMMGDRRVQAILVDDDRDEETPPPHGDEVTQFTVSLDAQIWFEEQ